jgi:hypothetical protein
MRYLHLAIMIGSAFMAGVRLERQGLVWQHAMYALLWVFAFGGFLDDQRRRRSRP